MVRRAAEARFRLVTSPVLLTELLQSMSKPKHIGLSASDPVASFVRLVVRIGELVEPPAPTLRIATHPEDDWVLATAQAGKADYPVSGDKQLLALDGRHGLGRFRIVAAADLLALLEEQEAPKE